MELVWTIKEGPSRSPGWACVSVKGPFRRSWAAVVIGESVC